jgi:hypothetical protein
VTIESIDAMAVLEAAIAKPGKMAVNMRVGQTLLIRLADGALIRILLEARHGRGARVQVHAPADVKVTPP